MKEEPFPPGYTGSPYAPRPRSPEKEGRYITPIEDVIESRFRKWPELWEFLEEHERFESYGG